MSKNIVTLKSGSKVTQCHRNQHGSIRPLTYDFLLTFHSNHGSISHRFRDRRRFQSKIAKFSNPVYFTIPLTGFPLDLGIGAGIKKPEWWATRRSRKFWDRFSCYRRVTDS